MSLQSEEQNTFLLSEMEGGDSNIKGMKELIKAVVEDSPEDIETTESTLNEPLEFGERAIRGTEGSKLTPVDLGGMLHNLVDSVVEKCCKDSEEIGQCCSELAKASLPEDGVLGPNRGSKEVLNEGVGNETTRSSKAWNQTVDTAHNTNSGVQMLSNGTRENTENRTQTGQAASADQGTIWWLQHLTDPVKLFFLLLMKWLGQGIAKLRAIAAPSHSQVSEASPSFKRKLTEVEPPDVDQEVMSVDPKRWRGDTGTGLYLSVQDFVANILSGTPRTNEDKPNDQEQNVKEKHCHLCGANESFWQHKPNINFAGKVNVKFGDAKMSEIRDLTENKRTEDKDKIRENADIGEDMKSNERAVLEEAVENI